MRPLAIPAGVLLVLALAPAAPAATRPAFKVVATSVVPLVSDGASAAAYMPTADTVRVIRARGGAGVTIVAPPPCVASIRGEGLRAVGGGYLLYACPQAFAGQPASTGYVVQSIATGEARRVTGTLPIGDSGSPPTLDAVGSVGLGGTISNHHGDGFPFDLNWHTGMQIGWPQSPLSDRGIRDLDRPGLTRRMCAPLRRTLQPAVLGDTQPGVFRPYLYSRPWGVGFVATRSDRRPRLVLQRCGSTRRTTLAAGPVSQLGGGGGVVTWVSVGPKRLALHAYSLATRRHKVSTTAPDANLRAGHLGGLLFRSTIATRVGGGDLTPLTWTIEAARAFANR